VWQCFKAVSNVLSHHPVYKASWYSHQPDSWAFKWRWIFWMFWRLVHKWEKALLCNKYPSEWIVEAMLPCIQGLRAFNWNNVFAGCQWLMPVILATQNNAFSFYKQAFLFWDWVLDTREARLEAGESCIQKYAFCRGPNSLPVSVFH
jgi:hypothetical protein